MADPKDMSPGQRAYEERQARKDGKTLDARLAAKTKEKTKLQAEAARAASPSAAPRKKPGLISRLLDRAHKPL